MLEPLKPIERLEHHELLDLYEAVQVSRSFWEELHDVGLVQHRNNPELDALRWRLRDLWCMWQLDISELDEFER